MAGLTFLIIFLFLMALVAVVPQFLRRLHLPSVVSILLIGMAIGPNSFDLIDLLNRFMASGFNTDRFYFIIESIGLLGLVFLMALAGMEVDLDIIKTEKKAVFWLSVLTFLLPALAGFGVYYWFSPDDYVGQLVYASLFASHSVGIVFPVIRELKIAKTRFGVSVLASTVITDVASLIMLAIAIQLKRQSFSSIVPGSISVFDKIDSDVLAGWFFPLFFIAILAYIAFSLWALPRAAKFVFERVSPRDDSRLTFFLVGVLVVVFLGELIGVSAIVGSFVAGMAMMGAAGFHDHGSILHKKIEGLAYGILIPFLFLSIGMKTDLPILFSASENAAIVLTTFVGLVGSKIFSGWIAMRLSGFGNKKGVCAGLMTIPQLSATLAAAAVALQLNMLDGRFFNAIVCLSILTTVPVPTLVRVLVLKCNIKFEDAEGMKEEEVLENG